MEQIFESELKMQEWLSHELLCVEGLMDLIINKEDHKNLYSDSVVERKFFESYRHCIKSLNLNTIVSENENISFKEGDIFKPDFLLFAPKTESIVIVELKNIAGPSRQVGTEVSAYSSEVKSYIPFISEGDIINVIISPTWPTLLRHYIFHEIFWLQKNIICLEPCKSDNSINLRIVEIPKFIEDNVSLKLSPKHLGGYNLCLYDYNLYKEPSYRTRLDPYIEQMKTAISAIESKGNSQKNYGFAFLWKDKHPLSLAPYSITILNLAPFQSLERLFHDVDYKITEITKRFINLRSYYGPVGHGESLNVMTNYGKRFLEGFCEPRVEGFLTWDYLKRIMIPRCDLISFHSWGIFGELFSDKLAEEYEKGNIQLSSTDPKLGMELIDYLVDPEYEFIDLSDYE